MSAHRSQKGARPFRDVLLFTWRHWRRHPWLAAGTAGAMIGATLADMLMPIYAGRLVDTVGLLEADRDAARHAALAALAAMMALGAAMIVMRHLSFKGIVRLTLRIMA